MKKVDVKWMKQMSGTEGHEYDGKRELALSSKAEEIVDKKCNTTSIIWKWFGYFKSDEAQIKAVCKMLYYIYIY